MVQAQVGHPRRQDLRMSKENTCVPSVNQPAAGRGRLCEVRRMVRTGMADAPYASAMWIRLNLDLTAIFLPMATGFGTAIYVLIALGVLIAAGWVQHPRRLLRVAAWAASLAACSAVLTALPLLVNLPWPDDDLVHALLWVWLVLFLAGLALVVWQGWRRE